MSKLEITVDNGKYTLIVPDDDYRITVLRYGEDWLKIERGSNAIHSLMIEAAAAVRLRAALDIAVEELTEQESMGPIPSRVLAEIRAALGESD